AEEDDQRHQPLLIAPQAACTVGDGWRGAAQHQQRARDLSAAVNHATASSRCGASCARCLLTSVPPATSRSMPERRKVEYPSTARLTIGSPARLKLVLSSTGMPLRAPYASRRAWKRGAR